ncbi:ankyrin repeat-containing domain protein [Podospora aff. communis PSN243]|uniref:Ankyrin repeat-containing domain protein n=1 Tax=Podospora aff. communis PSN243 TaxID=3040156 RepID=A0AAV9H039_9PEZI|nr:ankyrin repeat-containing domain protein [Podospora aff. communis PSN243]
MEVASAIGLVAAIVQLIDTTAKIIGHVNAVKNAPTERAQFARQASSLLALLTDLRYRAEEAESTSDPWFSALRGLGIDGGPIDQLHHQMERLAAKLDPSTGRLKAAGRALMWVVDRNEVEEVLTRIERLKSSISLALQSDHFELTLAVKQGLTDVKGDVRKVLSDAATKRDDQKFQQVTAWLSSVDCKARHVDSLSRWQPGTGAWFLSHPRFQQWLVGDTDRILWCSGLPGAGKTTLAAMVVDWISSRHIQDQQAVVGYLYCNYKEAGHQTPEAMLGSLLRQVILHRGCLPKDLEDASTTANPPDLEMLSRVLAQEAEGHSKIFFVIDALDECSDSNMERTTLLGELEILPANFRILVTSRHTRTMAENLRHATHIDISATADDVQRYVMTRVKKDLSAIPRLLSDKCLVEEIANAIVAKSEGMFLLAQLHMNNLSKKLTIRQVRSTLGSLPKELDATYDQAMERIRGQSDAQAALACRVLYWVVSSMRPMKADELRHALAVEPGDEGPDEDGLYETGQLVSSCAGLVTIDEGSTEIRLVHYTAQSYFEGPGMALLQAPPSMIANICLTYLSFHQFTEPPCQSFDDDRRVRQKQHPFLEYAAQHWADHARDDWSPDVRKLILSLLSNGFSILNILLFNSRYVDDDWSRAFGGSGDLNLSPLHVVALFGVNSVVERILLGGADVNAKAEGWETPLHLAAKAGHQQMVLTLLKAGADVNAKNDKGQGPLDVAARRGLQGVVQVLINAGADRDNRGGPRYNDSEPALHQAVSYGHLDAACVLVNAGADINKRLSNDGGEASGADALGPSPLQLACQLEHGIELVRFLLDHGADVSVTDSSQRTLLHELVLHNHHNIELAILLIEKGVDFNAKDKDGNTALHLAALKQYIELVELLLERGADATATNHKGKTAIDLVLDLELKSGIQLDRSDSWRTPRLRSEFLEEMEATLELLNFSASKGMEMEELLHEFREARRFVAAILENNETTVESYLRNGADSNLKVNYSLVADGIPILHLASFHKPWNEKTVKSLLDNGANLHWADESGRTALHWAGFMGNSHAAQLFISHGASVHTGDSYGATPLHYAVAAGRLEVSKLLLDHGAHHNQQTTCFRKETPMAWIVCRDPLTRSLGEKPPMCHALWGVGGGETEQSRAIRTSERLALLDLFLAKDNNPNVLSCTWAACFKSESDPKYLEGNTWYPEQQHVAIAKHLLDKGLDVSTPCYGSLPALYLAASRLRMDFSGMLRLLISYSADVHYRTPRWDSKLVQSWRMAYELMEPPTSGSTALHAAVSMALHSLDSWVTGKLGLGALSGVKLLVDSGANMYAADGKGVTPIYMAIDRGSIRVLDFLLSNGGELNRQHGPNRETLLLYAVLRRETQVVQYLLRKGADVTIPDINGSTALDRAKMMGHQSIIFLLRRHQGVGLEPVDRKSGM